MLTVILGDKDSEELLKNHTFVDYNDGLFDAEYQEEWFKDSFIQRILKEIDHIDLSKSSGTSFVNSITGNIHSQKELSTGCKTLILMHKYPDVVFQARFGDNCTDFVEEIASTNDIIIKSGYLHSFNFKYISEINYINYNKVAKNKKDIYDLLQAFRDDNVDFSSENADNDDDLTLEDLRKKHPRLTEELVKHLGR